MRCEECGGQACEEDVPEGSDDYVCECVHLDVDDAPSVPCGLETWNDWDEVLGR